MSRFFHTLWNHEFATGKSWYRPVLLTCLLLIGLAYPFAEVFLINYPKFGLDEYIRVTDGEALPHGSAALSRIFLPLWLSLAVACVAFRAAVIILAYRKTMRMVDPGKFHRDFVVYLQATVIALLVSLGALWLLNLSLYALGAFPESGGNVFSFLLTGLHDALMLYVPTVVEVHWYPGVILLALLGSEFSLWFIHWLTHRSRVLWLTLHRAHHCAETYHPLSNAPAFVFEFVLSIPRVALIAIWSKLFHAEPLVLEGCILFLAVYFVEIFNHAEAYYVLAYQHPVLRALCVLTGNGIYHLLHHSSAKEHQMVNLAGGPFNIVDRILGTYASPPPQTPRFGLTGNPDLYLNPMRIIFSGFAQLAYELRHNTGIRTKLRILFGSVYYQPPLSKEFLIRGYPEKSI